MTYQEPALLRPKQAAQYLGIGIATFWRLAKNDESFPRVFKIGAQSSAVYKADLDGWIKRRQAGA